MNWLTKSVLPKIKAFVNKEKTIQNLWIKCNSCNQMIFEKDLKKNLNICSMCNFHMPYYPQERLKSLFDENKFEQIDDLHSINKIQNWKIELILDPKKRSEKMIPDWYGYMRIDQK